MLSTEVRSIPVHPCCVARDESSKGRPLWLPSATSEASSHCLFRPEAVFISHWIEPWRQADLRLRNCANMPPDSNAGAAGLPTATMPRSRVMEGMEGGPGSTRSAKERQTECGRVSLRLIRGSGTVPATPLRHVILRLLLLDRVRVGRHLA
jgi:hypothetical protein